MSVSFSFRKGTVEKGKFDSLERTQRFPEDHIGGSRTQDEALKVLVERISFVQRVAYLIPHAFRVQKANALKPTEVSKKVASRLVQGSTQFADVICFPGV